jgi:hypothetical protein
MKPPLPPASTAPTWLANIFPGLNDHIDATDYSHEEQVARMIGGGLPETWVRAGLTRLTGGPWQDRLLCFADTNATALAALGWQLGDLFPPDELTGPRDHMRGLGWPLLDALDSGGHVVERTASRIAYATVKGARVVIER